MTAFAWGVLVVVITGVGFLLESNEAKIVQHVPGWVMNIVSSTLIVAWLVSVFNTISLTIIG